MRKVVRSWWVGLAALGVGLFATLAVYRGVAANEQREARRDFGVRAQEVVPLTLQFERVPPVEQVVGRLELREDSGLGLLRAKPGAPHMQHLTDAGFLAP